MAKTAKLSSGQEMPLLGLGTWKSERGKAGNAVRAAIEGGYRLVDCANDYGNEDEIGDTIASMISEGSIKREDLFIQAKLWNANHRPKHVRTDLTATLKDLQVEYLDSYIIHWPQACPATGEWPALRPDSNLSKHRSERSMFPVDDEGYYCSDNGSHYVETYHAMEELIDEGLVRSIGLSNFNATQIHEIMQNVRKHKPTVLQNECHPYLQQKDVIDLCRHYNIQFQAFSPLGSGDRPWVRQPGVIEVMDNPKLKEIADAHGKSTAQVVLRWHMQRGVSAVPKSVTPERIRANIDIYDFELNAEEMDVFDRLNISRRFLLMGAFSAHPDYPFKDELPWDYTTEKPPSNTQKSSK